MHPGVTAGGGVCVSVDAQLVSVCVCPDMTVRGCAS